MGRVWIEIAIAMGAIRFTPIVFHAFAMKRMKEKLPILIHDLLLSLCKNRVNPHASG